jgi:hypothetical protein
LGGIDTALTIIFSINNFSIPQMSIPDEMSIPDAFAKTSFFRKSGSKKIMISNIYKCTFMKKGLFARPPND